ncbi:MAG: hypothetical protein RL711_1850 [Bacteroidota bacterium]|jgi:outer membrane biosynthesis protein TonB
MFVQSKEERRNDIIGMAVSIIIHALLFLLCFFVFVYKAPNPPIPQYGEIRLGYDATGSGESNEQINTPPSPENEPTPEEATPTPTPESQAQAITNPDGEGTITETTEKKTSIKKTDTKKTTTASNPNSVYNPDKKTNTAGGGNSTPGGTQGNPNGVYNGKGEGGVGLDMAGWQWDAAPDVRDISVEAGKVVLKVAIDEKGEILDVDIIESTINKSLANKYRLKVMGMTFSKTDGNMAPSRSEGRITFTIKSR